MKTIALSIAPFFLLCLPALAREEPPSDVRTLAVEGFDEALQKSNQFAERKEYGKAIEVLDSWLAAGELWYGAEHISVLYMQTLLGKAYFEKGDAQKAYTIFQSALENCTNNDRDYQSLATLIRMALIHIDINTNNTKNTYTLLQDAIIGSFLYYDTSYQSMILFINSYVHSLNGRTKEATFFTKLWLGIEAFCTNYQCDKYFKTNKDVIATAMDMKLSINLRDVITLVNSENSSVDTPYNKSRRMMSDIEERLYTEFSVVAKKLTMAGSNVPQVLREDARRSFIKWLAAVDEAFNPTK